MSFETSDERDLDADGVESTPSLTYTFSPIDPTCIETLLSDALAATLRSTEPTSELEAETGAQMILVRPTRKSVSIHGERRSVPLRSCPLVVVSSIEEAVEVARAGALVILSPGEHWLQRSVRIRERVTLVGLGPLECVRILVPACLEAGLAFEAKGCVVSNCVFTGVSPDASVLEHLDRDARVVYEKPDFRSSLICIEGAADDTKISYANFHGGGITQVGIRVCRQSFGVVVESCSLTDFSDSCVYVSEGSQSSLSCVTFGPSERSAGLVCEHEGSVAKVEFCLFQNLLTGASVEESTCYMHSSTIANCSIRGVWCSGRGSRFTLHRSSIRSVRSGILVDQFASAHFFECQVFQVQDSFANVTDDQSSLIIDRTVIEGCDGSETVSVQGKAKLRISSSQIERAAGCAIMVEESFCSLADVRIHQCQTGISVKKAMCVTDIMCQNCTISDCSRNGAMVSSGGSIFLDNCSIENCEANGVYVEDCGWLFARSCRFVRNYQDGLRSSGCNVICLLSECVCEGNGGNGLLVRDGARTLLSSRCSLMSNKMYGTRISGMQSMCIVDINPFSNAVHHAVSPQMRNLQKSFDASSRELYDILSAKKTELDASLFLDTHMFGSNEQSGIHCDGESIAMLSNCYFVNHALSHISCESQALCIIENCVFRNSGKTCLDLSNLTIVYGKQMDVVGCGRAFATLSGDSKLELERCRVIAVESDRPTALYQIGDFAKVAVRKNLNYLIPTLSIPSRTLLTVDIGDLCENLSSWLVESKCKSAELTSLFMCSSSLSVSPDDTESDEEIECDPHVSIPIYSAENSLTSVPFQSDRISSFWISEKGFLRSWKKSLEADLKLLENFPSVPSSSNPLSLPTAMYTFLRAVDIVRSSHLSLPPSHHASVHRGDGRDGSLLRSVIGNSDALTASPISIEEMKTLVQLVFNVVVYFRASSPLLYRQSLVDLTTASDEQREEYVIEDDMQVDEMEPFDIEMSDLNPHHRPIRIVPMDETHTSPPSVCAYTSPSGAVIDDYSEYVNEFRLLSDSNDNHEDSWSTDGIYPSISYDPNEAIPLLNSSTCEIEGASVVDELPGSVGQGIVGPGVLVRSASPDLKLLVNLLDMGYTEEDARRALSACGNDLHRACEFLMDGG